MPKSFLRKLFLLNPDNSIPTNGACLPRHKKLFEPASWRATTGYGLIEVIIASFILIVGIGGAFALIQQNISSVSVVEHRLQAIELAQEGAEIVHAIQKSNFIAIQYGQEDPPGMDVVFAHNGLNSDPITGCGSGCQVQCITGSFPNCSALGNNLVEVELVPFTDTFLNYESATAVYSQGGAGSASLFKRKITITEPNTAECPASDCLAANVEVTWSEKGKPQNIQVETRIYNWLGI